MALRSQTILSSLFRGRSTFRPAPVKEKSSIRQPPTRSPAILIYRDALYAYRLAAEPKELYIVPGAGHVDLYDRASLIPFGKLTDFFTKNLK